MTLITKDLLRRQLSSITFRNISFTKMLDNFCINIFDGLSSVLAPSVTKSKTWVLASKDSPKSLIVSKNTVHMVA